MPLRDEWEYLVFTSDCRTLLHLAAESGETEVVIALLEAGANWKANT